MSTKLERQYRQVIAQLATEPGLCIDATCPQCGHPEMSLRVEWPAGTPLDPAVLLCRKCGHAQRTRPTS